MDLSGADVSPAEGRVLLRFVDDEDDEESSRDKTGPALADSVPYEGCLALILAVGPKTGTLKKGQMAICTPYARDGLKLGDNTVMTDVYNIVGTLK